MRMQKMNCRLIASRGFSVENLYVNGLYAVIAICLLLASPAVFMGQTPSDDQSSEKTIIPSSWTDADNGYQVIPDRRHSILLAAPLRPMVRI